MPTKTKKDNLRIIINDMSAGFSDALMSNWAYGLGGWEIAKWLLDSYGVADDTDECLELKELIKLDYLDK